MTKLWKLRLSTLCFTSLAWAGAFDQNQRQNTSSISAYFNQRASRDFVEPYRKIRRSGEDFQAPILERIEKAEKRIWLAVQEFRLTEIAHALIKKKEQGVDVRVILENSYSANFPFSSRSELENAEGQEASRNLDYFYFIDENRDGLISNYERETRDVPSLLRAAKIPVIDDTFDGSKGSGLMHHKFMIVDDEDLVMTSANFTWSDFYGDFLKPETRGNANFLLTFKNAALVKSFETEFSEMWLKKRFGVKKAFRGKQISQLDGKDMWVQYAPTGAKVPWESSALGSVTRELEEAKGKIQIAQFVFSEQKIADRLQDWVDNTEGVLKVLVDKDFIYQDYSEVLDMLGLKMLNRFCNYEKDNNPWSSPLEEGIGTPRLAQGDKFHHKFAVLDSKRVVLGSLNWSPSGNHENDETVMSFEDEFVAKQFEEEFERSYKNSWTTQPSWLFEKIKEREQSCSRGQGSN